MLASSFRRGPHTAQSTIKAFSELPHHAFQSCAKAQGVNFSRHSGSREYRRDPEYFRKSWWDERVDAVGLAETAVPDPDGEDVCAFGTHLMCLPFSWRNGHMTALPTVGGNNGQASAINNRGQIAGYAQTAVT